MKLKKDKKNKKFKILFNLVKKNITQVKLLIRYLPNQFLKMI